MTGYCYPCVGPNTIVMVEGMISSEGRQRWDAVLISQLKPDQRIWTTRGATFPAIKKWDDQSFYEVSDGRESQLQATAQQEFSVLIDHARHQIPCPLVEVLATDLLAAPVEMFPGQPICQKDIKSITAHSRGTGYQVCVPGRFYASGYLLYGSVE